MDTKIFLQGYNSKKSVNTSEGLNLSLKGKRKLLPTNDVAEVISQNDQYMEEREACNIIRLTCQVNPICSNVLFNRVSEIVKDEGSSSVTYINYGVCSGETDATEEVLNNIFSKVKYKEKTIGFWSGNVFGYQQMDREIYDLSKQTPLTDITTMHTAMTVTVTENAGVDHPTNSIRDMQLSNDNFIYHCGLDILNNHLIRSNTFKTICRMPEDFDAMYSDYGAFNTIADLMRDVNGNKVVEKLYFPITAGVNADHTKLVTMHLYEYDDIYSFEKCIENRLEDTFNGWIGFYNRPKIKSYEVFSVDHTKSSKEEIELEIERPIMYMNGGDFVDMYPDRSLYSFVPKYNHYRNRIEKNWNYCLTYPSSSTTEGFEDIIETSNGLNSLKTIYFDENTIADNGTRQLVIYSIAKHGLAIGDFVNIYSDGVKVVDNAEVKEIADDYIFTVFNDNIKISNIWIDITEGDGKKQEIVFGGKTYVLDGTRKFYNYVDAKSVVTRYYIVNDRYVNLDNNAQNISYKKVVNDIECEYYVRIFSKIPNFKNASADTSTEYQIYRNNAELIDMYQDQAYDFESHVSRLAFAKNVYTDEVGEVVFTDDIDISNLRDNLGRPLSSIYLTLVKNNDGYKEWYGYDLHENRTWDVTEITADTVEYSHCFGNIKCGFETSDESRFSNDINSIYRINNIDARDLGYDINAINQDRTIDGFDIEDNEIWFDLDKHYYGDLSYYDSYNAVERHIQPIMHRVNTAQRESHVSSSDNYYNKFVYDEIIKDDYDTGDAYTIASKTIEECNLKKEGYYYSPHYEIRIRTFDKIQTVLPDFLTIRSLINTSYGSRITTLQNHYLTVGDKAVIYDMTKNIYYYCTTVSGDKDNSRVFTCRIYDEQGHEKFLNDLLPTAISDKEDPHYNSDFDVANFKLFKMDNLNIPSYARILKDGTCRLIWRNILNNGFNLSDKTVEEYPFTNGAFYINRRVDLYLRRQDPYAFYGLYSEDDIYGNELNIDAEDNYVKDTEIVC